MQVTLEAIMNYSKAPELVERARKALEDEARRRHEFREWVTENVKAEFINGEIVLHSPVRRKHSIAAEFTFTLLSLFARLKKLGEVRFDKAMVALTRNDYEPDVCFWENEKSDAFDEETMLYPAPDFVIEVLSRRTQKTDRTTKFKDYALHGVREYWIVDPAKKVVEQYGLLTDLDDSYLPYGKFIPGDEITSLVLPDFTIAVEAIFNEDANLKAIQQLMRN